MAIINRVTRLFAADMHAVLDRLEEPESLLRQAVREMEEVLAQAEQSVRVLDYEHRQLANRKADGDATLTSIDAELDLCFESKQETLARSLIKRKLQTERANLEILRMQQALEVTRNATHVQIEENRVRLDSMRQKAAIFAAGIDNEHSDNTTHGKDAPVSAEDIEIALLRERKRRTKG